MGDIDIKNLGLTDIQLNALGYVTTDYLVFSKWTNEKTNSNGYDYKERDILCKSCFSKITKQTSWTDFDGLFEYKNSEFKNFNNCPYCGAKIR
jgi:DNA-directed RNA polymerase subunit RPC12/RpoP